jgi:hypothetical protein
VQTPAAFAGLCPDAGSPAQAAALAAQLGDTPHGCRLAAAYLNRAPAGTFTGYRIELLLRRAPQLDTAVDQALGKRAHCCGCSRCCRTHPYRMGCC